MRDLERPDATQMEILSHLGTTESLLRDAARRESGRGGDAEIVPLPDLGLPHNVTRMRGGFFTGAYYSWTSVVPIAPIDATVNLCGVALFRVNADFSSLAEFLARVDVAKKMWQEDCGFVWNFERGNHFLIYGEAEPGGLLPKGRYLAVHASPAEFKWQFQGLYPRQGNWYWHDVRTVGDPSGRYLRYLAGRSAERFYGRSLMMRSYQVERQRIIADLVVGSAQVESEVLNTSHYEMPHESGVIIGGYQVDVRDPHYLLLTSPGEDLFYVEALPGGRNEVLSPAEKNSGAHVVCPHGLGLTSDVELTINFLPDRIQLNGQEFRCGGTIEGWRHVRIRPFAGARGVQELLEAFPGRIVSQLRQIYAYHGRG